MASFKPPPKRMPSKHGTAFLRAPVWVLDGDWVSLGFRETLFKELEKGPTKGCGLGLGGAAVRRRNGGKDLSLGGCGGGRGEEGRERRKRRVGTCGEVVSL